MINLKTLQIQAPEPSKPIPLENLVADHNFAPQAWQSQYVPENGLWGRDPVSHSADLDRIIALPRRPEPEDHTLAAEAMIELISARFANGRPAGAGCSCAELKRPCITRLLLVQSWALYEIGLVGGLLGPIAVGAGKTILDLLAPLAMRDCKLAVLLIPPTLLDQTVGDYIALSQHFRVPSLVVHGRDYTNRVDGAPVLHVFPYSRLSRAEATVWLEQVKPDTIIADEAQNLRNLESTRTGRFMRFCDANQSVRFLAWSGSLTDSKLQDYAHLAALALRENSPLPLEKDTVDDWGRALNPGKFPAPAGALMQLCDPGEHVSDGFRRRLLETRGVVSKLDSSFDGDLIIEERKAPPVPDVVRDALNDLRASWMRPDGEELIDAMSVARACRELACGFFYRWIFPRGESVATIMEWLEARKQWRKELREMLKSRAEYMDSPLLCARAAARAWGDREVLGEGHLPVWKSETWPRWRKARGTVEPKTQAVRLDPYLAEDSAAWGLENRGIIWYAHQAFGEWVAELSGLPLHGGGPTAGTRIAAEKGDRSIIASLKSHGTGRNGLQWIFNTQLVATPPPGSDAWEQMLGRLHRQGQKSDKVYGYFYRHTPELRAHVEEALSRALYVQSTLGASQKLRKGFAIPGI